MRGIFVSYRHDDSFANAKLLVEHLGRWLPDAHIFIDESGIEAGAEWRATLQKELDEAQAVLVVIGPRWTTMATQTGISRLEDPDDVVRWEICHALDTGKRVVPVLVDGASLPKESELPPPLKVLARVQYRAIGRQTFDSDTEALARALSGADPARWIWLVKRAAVLVPVVSVILLLLVRTQLFDQVDVWFQHRVIWLGDGLTNVPIHDEVRIVALPLNGQPIAEAGNLRVELARLLDALTRQRPRRVIFDATVEEERDGDDRLAASIRTAVQSGVQVTFGFKAFDPASHEPKVARKIEEAGAKVGVVCVGDRSGGQRNVTLATLALIRNNRTYPSLSLLGAYDQLPPNWLVASSSELHLPGLPAISLMQAFDEPSSACPARTRGTVMARFVPHQAPLATLRRPPVRYSFDDVVRSGNPGEFAFQGKTVLVGIEQERDRFQTPVDLADKRYGFEFQANAISALLAKRVVIPMKRQGQTVSVLVMAALGAVLRLSRVAMARQRARWMPWVALALYAVVAVVAYWALDRLWQPVFPAVAFVATWAGLSFLDRRWSDGKR
jgi:hypothetical protein